MDFLALFMFFLSFKCSLNIRVEALIFELNKSVYGTVCSEYSDIWIYLNIYWQIYSFVKYSKILGPWIYSDIHSLNFFWYFLWMIYWETNISYCYLHVTNFDFYISEILAKFWLWINNLFTKAAKYGSTIKCQLKS